MKWFAVLFLLAFTAKANAASPEQHYLDMRDRYIAKFSKSETDEESSKQHTAALEQLATALRAVTGPVTIKGMPKDGTSNVDTLDKRDSGFGHLDGLAFTSEGDKTHVVVTTTTLLKQWLRTRREDGLQQAIDAALRSSEFYYWAIQDAAFAKYADLPITKPAGATAAVAVLGVRGNGDLKGTPGEIGVVVIQGEKVFYVDVREALKTGLIPACEKVWKQMMAKPINKKDPRGDLKHEDEAMAAHTKCFAKEAPQQRWFAAAVKKAQSQLDLLPLR
ncbi:hypothetical protein JQ596_29870 [Bradyrhizobium manausense]|uniref:hypothetical protein n=1 Tax=Bradyrhizobium TaxID=374 RepID=UPI001BA95D76|nr:MULTISPECIES: hypothetical protein [Bradyrhizobium]MBR0829748.1 hypothetical protein [Bradyrhizobium manausense]UVO25360.1 hypothetical protein KUF59_22405 [Bradyrhizobium arachidis]